jgi:hypothetical protein
MGYVGALHRSMKSLLLYQHIYIYMYIVQNYTKMVLHVSVFLYHLQGAYTYIVLLNLYHIKLIKIMYRNISSYGKMCIVDML